MMFILAVAYHPKEVKKIRGNQRGEFKGASEKQHGPAV
jgi:hypothetical protein